MAFRLPDLPYPKDALGEFMSAETFDYHHGKHHNAYVTKANELVAEDNVACAWLEDGSVLRGRSSNSVSLSICFMSFTALIHRPSKTLRKS